SGLESQIRVGCRGTVGGCGVHALNVGKLRAEIIAEQALILASSSGNATPRARAEAERATGMASLAAWIVFSVIALSLILGLIGGALGAHGSRRKTWGGTLETSAPS